MARAFKQGELVARFLPVKDLQTGKIVRACARVFWNHPEYGVLPGYAFRAIFERTGVARQVDKFLLEESFKLLAKTADIEAVSVVLSPLHAYNPYYAAELKKRPKNITLRPGGWSWIWRWKSRGISRIFYQPGPNLKKGRLFGGGSPLWGRHRHI